MRFCIGTMMLSSHIHLFSKNRNFPKLSFFELNLSEKIFHHYQIVKFVVIKAMIFLMKKIQRSHSKRKNCAEIFEEKWENTKKYAKWKESKFSWKLIKTWFALEFIIKKNVIARLVMGQRSCVKKFSSISFVFLAIWEKSRIFFVVYDDCSLCWLIY